mmetsp:Transcript_24613/g.24206  ORF Transcript_24613/g.24206 Transcript_24613/m.24206 type:complete len:129 (+) Transcript_24613:603-989(+)
MKENGNAWQHVEIQKSYMYTPIKNLGVYNYDWKIKARVTKKYDRREWKNSKSQGWIMNIELMDAFKTQIVGTFFNDAVDIFERQIKEGNVNENGHCVDLPDVWGERAAEQEGLLFDQERPLHHLRQEL